MKLGSIVEALLFVAAKPLSIKQLADLAEIDEQAIELALVELTEDCRDNDRGIVVVVNDRKAQLVSAPETADLVSKLIKSEVASELTRPSLEALTVIAYRGPVSKLELDRIRGVNCAMILRNLLLRGLIEAHTDKATDETMYQATFDFLRFLGLERLADLPDYERLHSNAAIDRAARGEEAVSLDQAVINNEE